MIIETIFNILIAVASFIVVIVCLEYLRVYYVNKRRSDMLAQQQQSVLDVQEQFKDIWEERWK